MDYLKLPPQKERTLVTDSAEKIPSIFTSYGAFTHATLIFF